MIQVNLLPDIKQSFIKAKRLKRIVVLVSATITALTLLVFLVLLLSVHLWQKSNIKGLDNNIKKLSSQLEATPDLSRILTVQNQLKSLPGLHQQKPAAKRLFTYLAQTTPNGVTISTFKLDFENSKIEVTGAAGNLEIVNKFVDTLKFTKYKENPNSSEENAFKDVVLTNFGHDSQNSTATYTLTYTFVPIIFEGSAKDVALIVPQNFISTRSETERPQSLFDQADPGALTQPEGGQ